jgi:hypothetical protein
VYPLAAIAVCCIRVCSFKSNQKYGQGVGIMEGAWVCTPLSFCDWSAMLTVHTHAPRVAITVCCVMCMQLQRQPEARPRCWYYGGCLCLQRRLAQRQQMGQRQRQLSQALNAHSSLLICFSCEVDVPQLHYPFVAIVCFSVMQLQR